MVHGGHKDFSPVSLRAAMLTHHPWGLCAFNQKSQVKRFSTLVRLGGGGYRVTGRSHSTLSRSWERIRVMSQKPPISNDGMPLELWLGRGYPINPYLRGDLLFFIREYLKPKELRLPPSDLLVDGEVEILERTMIRRWMTQWLKVVSWNHFHPSFYQFLSRRPGI